MKKGSNLARNISRTSSEKSAEKEQAAEYQLQNDGAQILRMQSYNRIFKDNQSHGNAQEHFSSEVNSHIIDEKVEEADNNELESAGTEKYQSYRQMCKDIEFIQMLGNPSYVMCLFNRGYLYSKDFKDYINGLKYFLKKPELMRLIKYPEGLYNLELLLKKGFTESLENPSFQQRFIVDSLKRTLQIKSNTKKWRDLQIAFNQPQN